MACELEQRCEHDRAISVVVNHQDAQLPCALSVGVLLEIHDAGPPGLNGSRVLAQLRNGFVQSRKYCVLANGAVYSVRCAGESS
jgi:hypothetical protein